MFIIRNICLFDWNLQQQKKGAKTNAQVSDTNLETRKVDEPKMIQSAQSSSRDQQSPAVTGAPDDANTDNIKPDRIPLQQTSPAVEVKADAIQTGMSSIDLLETIRHLARLNIIPYLFL